MIATMSSFGDNAASLSRTFPRRDRRGLRRPVRLARIANKEMCRRRDALPNVLPVAGFQG